MIWKSQAPSNIALIKYMGKSNTEINRPANSSLSYTLDYLVSQVEIEAWERPYDGWEPLTASGFKAPELSPEGKKKFLAHLQHLKELFLYDGHFVVRSANNFPADCGVASSASSFAALTRAACSALTDVTYSHKDSRPNLTANELANLSRKGSGSSCRSFYPEWVLWRGDSVEPYPLPQQKLIHVLAIVDDGKKLVSSSQAHQRVISSLLYQGRVERAENRLTNLLKALHDGQWEKAFQISWAEFWDMHALFETADPHFGYMAQRSIWAMNLGRKMWAQRQNGPLITMDAGANVHFLFRLSDRALAFDLLQELKQYCAVLTNLDESTSLRHGT